MKREQRGWLLPAVTLCLAAGMLLGKRNALWLYPAVGAALALPAVLLLTGRGRFAALCALALCMGALRGSVSWHPALPAEGTCRMTGVVAEEIRPGRLTQYRTTLRDVTLDGMPLRGGAYWSFYTDALPEGLQPGCAVSAQVRLYHPAGQQNPGGYDFREYLLQRGVRVGLYGMTDLTVGEEGFSLWGQAARVRSALAGRLVEVMGESGGGFASAVLLGTRTLLPEEDRDAFQRLGIGHILSVSGFHVGLLAGFLSMLLRRLRTGPWPRFLLCALLLSAYAFLTGMNPPVIRAVLMFLLGEYGRLRGRKVSPLHTLCAAACLQLLANPTVLTGASFQLTYSAMLGMILLQPTLEKGLRPRRAIFKKILAHAAGAVAVQAGILLPLMYWYQELPLLSLPLNILVLSAASLLLGACWLMLPLMYVPLLGPAAGDALGQAIAWLTAGLRELSRRAGLTLWTAQANWLTALCWAGLLAALCFLWRRPLRRRLLPALGCLALMACSLIPLPHRACEYIQLSVGSADAAVLWDGDTVVAVDTGEDGLALSTWLHQRRLSVDTLIITHLHNDHAGGIAALLDSGIPVRQCLLAQGAKLPQVSETSLLLLRRLREEGTEMVYTSRGDVFSLPHGRITVLWPEAGRVRPGSEANDYSLTALAEVRGSTLLLTGDLDGLYENYAAVPADLLKAAHHGSLSSSGAAFLETVSPEAILVSGGDQARLDAMRERAPDTPVYGTAESGALTVRFEEGGFTVRPFLLQQ